MTRLWAIGILQSIEWNGWRTAITDVRTNAICAVRTRIWKSRAVVMSVRSEVMMVWRRKRVAQTRAGLTEAEFLVQNALRHILHWPRIHGLYVIFSICGWRLEVEATAHVIGMIPQKWRVNRPQWSTIRTPTFSWIVWTSSVDIVWILCIERLFELLCLFEIELFFGLEHQLEQIWKLNEQEGCIHRWHRHPLPAENFAYFTCSHWLVLCRDLRSSSSSEYHESIHGALRRTISIECLRSQRTAFFRVEIQ